MRPQTLEVPRVSLWNLVLLQGVELVGDSVKIVSELFRNVTIFHAGPKRSDVEILRFLR